MIDGLVKDRYKVIWADCHLGEEDEFLQDGVCDTCYMAAGNEVSVDLIQRIGMDATLMGYPDVVEFLEWKADYDSDVPVGDYTATGGDEDDG